MQALRGAGYFLLATVLTMLAGCATGGKLVEPVPADKRQAVVERATVTRLKDGREGFVIRETPTMGSEARRDFEKTLALIDDGEYEQAVELLQTVIESSPGVTAPYINLAMACRQTGKTEQAEEYLKSALNLVEGHPVASNEYGLLLRHQGRFTEARAAYEQAIGKFPEYLPARRNLGILCDIYLNDQACALEHYQIYSANKPDDEQVKVWIADLRIRLGR